MIGEFHYRLSGRVHAENVAEAEARMRRVLHVVGFEDIGDGSLWLDRPSGPMDDRGMALAEITAYVDDLDVLEGIESRQREAALAALTESEHQELDRLRADVARANLAVEEFERSPRAAHERDRRRADIIGAAYFIPLTVALAVAVGSVADWLGLPAGLAAFAAVFVGGYTFDPIAGAVHRFVDGRVTLID